MKKRTLGLIIAGVAATSMIGTGFAAWVITASAEAEVQGQFNVDTVSNKGVTITPSFASGEGEINFFGPSGATTGWLTASGSTVEKLSTDLTIAFAFDNAQASDYNLTVAFTGTSAYDDAITAGYIVAPTFKFGATDYTIGTPVALDTIISGTSTTFTITFDWGAAFGGNNPYTFYNTFDYNDDYWMNGNTPVDSGSGAAAGKIQTKADTDLTAMNTMLDAAQFTITITATPKNA